MDIQVYKIKPELIDFLKSKYYLNYTDVQLQTIPKLLKNQDVVVKAPTGSGKTFAFLFPIITNTKINRTPQSIIFVPTRELGLQIKNELEQINKFLIEKIKVHLMIGGTAEDQDIKNFGKSEIIIATPNRLNKIQSNNSISLKEVKTIIIDEADMIEDFGFLEEITEIKEKYLKKNKINFGIFSATLNTNTKNNFKKMFNLNYQDITINRKETLKIFNIKLNDRNRLTILNDLLSQDYMNPFLAIIFAKSNEDVGIIYNHLKANNPIIADNLKMFNKTLEQRERKRLLNDLKNDKIQYLITTDLMSRGMDFLGATHIINYNLPIDMQYFLHRIGRTNRSQMKNGYIYTITDIDEFEILSNFSSKNDIEIEMLSLKKD